MWKNCLLCSAALLALLAACQADYTITPSNQVAYYHYPAPPKAQQALFDLQPQTTSRSSASQYYQTQASHQQPSYQSQTRYQALPSSGKSQYPTGANSLFRSAAKQFSSPALDNAAFNTALASHGYKTASSAPAGVVAGSSSNSLNVKLPLPFNITPLNIAPLPLQAGTPYSSIQNSVTSYGTTYPQRK